MSTEESRNTRPKTTEELLQAISERIFIRSPPWPNDPCEQAYATKTNHGTEFWVAHFTHVRQFVRSDQASIGAVMSGSAGTLATTEAGGGCECRQGP